MAKIIYRIGRISEKALMELEFSCGVARSIRQRIELGFTIHTYKPVLDDAPYRIFNTIAEYRRWCQKNLPSWLGYAKTD